MLLSHSKLKCRAALRLRVTYLFEPVEQPCKSN